MVTDKLNIESSTKRVIFQYTNAPRLNALLNGITDLFENELINPTQALSTKTNLDLVDLVLDDNGNIVTTSDGYWLDLIGERLGYIRPTISVSDTSTNVFQFATYDSTATDPFNPYSLTDDDGNSTDATTGTPFSGTNSDGLENEGKIFTSTDPTLGDIQPITTEAYRYILKLIALSFGNNTSTRDMQIYLLSLFRDGAVLIENSDLSLTIFGVIDNLAVHNVLRTVEPNEFNAIFLRPMGVRIEFQSIYKWMISEKNNEVVRFFVFDDGSDEGINLNNIFDPPTDIPDDLTLGDIIFEDDDTGTLQISKISLNETMSDWGSATNIISFGVDNSSGIFPVLPDLYPGKSFYLSTQTEDGDIYSSEHALDASITLALNHNRVAFGGLSDDMFDSLSDGSPLAVVLADKTNTRDTVFASSTLESDVDDIEPGTGVQYDDNVQHEFTIATFTGNRHLYYAQPITSPDVSEITLSSDSDVSISDFDKTSSAILYTDTHNISLASANSSPIGITYAPARFYVANQDRAFAYTTDGLRDSDNDFVFVTANANARGITYHDNKLWVVDRTDHKVYVYDEMTKRHLTDLDFNLINTTGLPLGITYADDKLWVADKRTDIAYAYNTDGTSSSSDNIDITDSPDGIATMMIQTESGTEVRILIADSTANTVQAYTLNNNRDSENDFSLGGNTDEVRGMTFWNNRIWTVDAGGTHIHAYSILDVWYSSDEYAGSSTATLTVTRDHT